jgi:WD domain, G-beta repeat.
LKSGQVTVLRGHFDEVTSVAVTSDNHYIISGSRDKTIRL